LLAAASARCSRSAPRVMLRVSAMARTRIECDEVESHGGGRSARDEKRARWNGGPGPARSHTDRRGPRAGFLQHRVGAATAEAARENDPRRLMAMRVVVIKQGFA
jgi:hypothetical protein